MGSCDRCEGDDALSYHCNECGGTFCSEHRLPESHNCEALRSKSHDAAWFKDELSVRKNRRSTRTVRTEDSEDSDQVERPENSSESTNDEHSSGVYDEECGVCDRTSTITCSHCGETYCYKHYTPDVHDCDYSETEPDDGDNDTMEAETAEGGDGESDSLTSDLGECSICSEPAVKDCHTCRGQFCEEHADRADHHGWASSNRQSHGATGSKQAGERGRFKAFLKRLASIVLRK